jgi:hypothetical protein
VKDLELWRRLHDDELDAHATAPLLDQLAALHLRQRFPFFGALTRALGHADPAVRAGAVASLRGADGLLAFRAMIAALDDAVEVVRASALEALRVSAAGHPARWMHALFHRRADVRRMAVATPGPPQADGHAVYLLADDACREVVVARLASWAGERALVADRSVAPLAPPPASFAALLTFARERALPLRLARRALAAVPWDEALRWLEAGARRTDEAAFAVLASGSAETCATAGSDAFDELFELFWERDETAVHDDRPAVLFHRLASAMPSWPVATQRRVVAAMLCVAARRGSLPEHAAEICVVYHPVFVTYTWIDRGARRAALRGLYAAGSGAPRRDDAEVRALLDDPLLCRPDGLLDLWAVGAVLHLLRSTPYKLLRRWLGTDRVVASFAADVEGSAPFLGLKDESRGGRRDLLERICRAHPARRARVLAVLALSAPADGLDFLAELEGRDAAEVLVEMLRVAARPTAAAAARIAHVLGPRVVPDFVGMFLDGWLSLPAPGSSRLGLEVLAVAAGALDAERFVEIASELQPERLSALLATLAHAAAFPYGKEAALAHALAGHPVPLIRAWAESRVPGAAAPDPRPARSPGAGRISDALANRIATCADRDLATALAPCSTKPSRGVAAALAARPVAAPSIAACVALLGAHDPMLVVDRVLSMYCDPSPPFLSDLDAQMVRAWGAEEDLPPLAHAWLHRWERHAFALVTCLEGQDGLAVGLQRATELATPLLAVQVWDAVASVLAMWRWRDRARFTDSATEPLVDALVEGLGSACGEPAARMLLLLCDSGIGAELLEPRRARVRQMLPDLSPETRAILDRWIDSAGLTGRTAPRRCPPALDADLLARIRASDDENELAELLRDGSARAVQEAALRLVELGDAGTTRMVALLEQGVGAAATEAIVESVALWPDGPAARAVAAHVDGPALSDELRFRLAVALFERGDRSLLARALQIACEPLESEQDVWFRAEDWAKLQRLGASAHELSLGLAASPQPHAYRAAIEHLLALSSFGACEMVAVRAFLDCGTRRMAELRRRAARWLSSLHDTSAFPVALADAVEQMGRSRAGVSPLGGIAPELVREAVDAVLFAGPRVAAELSACWMLETPDVDAVAAADGFARIATDALSDPVRERAMQRLHKSAARPGKLHRVAQTFAWGIRVGRELTGRVFRVQMIGGAALGYTRFGEDRIYVNPVPLLTGVAHGRAIVEALVLHELGHHLYHRGDEPEQVWKRAQHHGLFGLLNLVADEHLERNLRALDASFGDRLKRLAAWAFQHQDREVDARELLGALHARAFAVLSEATVKVARREGSVGLPSGELLGAMERAGLSFPRFVRALRMGLGNRHGDPRVEQALALFKGSFRRRSMAELLEVAERLRAIFGWEARMAETFGGHETLPSGESDRVVEGEGITDEELDAEIERVLDPRGRARAGAAAGRAGERRWINVSPEERFETIDRVVVVPFDPAQQTRYAVQVARHARQMRRYLERLGIALSPRRMRLRGRFDPSRARAVVLRGDPRMLIAREREVVSDLFLGVLVDCSGSMQAREHIERAKLFGAMLAEAARGLRGVDLRVWGFTDRVIYDAGSAERCAAHGLHADGGNNDAAALWHAAQTALSSRRRAKLLVVISDGLPTECSASALRALVRRLTGRMGVCCAQVAVQPLAEICFPNYVVLTEESSDTAVRRFGAIIARLLMRAMSA